MTTTKEGTTITTTMLDRIHPLPHLAVPTIHHIPQPLAAPPWAAAPTTRRIPTRMAARPFIPNTSLIYRKTTWATRRPLHLRQLALRPRQTRPSVVPTTHLDRLHHRGRLLHPQVRHRLLETIRQSM
jgi:hypothetical protein